MAPLVGVIMGSDSDLPVMKAACEMLENYAKKYTREKQAEKERKEAEKRTAVERGEVPATRHH